MWMLIISLYNQPLNFLSQAATLNWPLILAKNIEEKDRHWHIFLFFVAGFPENLNRRNCASMIEILGSVPYQLFYFIFKLSIKSNLTTNHHTISIKSWLQLCSALLGSVTIRQCFYWLQWYLILSLFMKWQFMGGSITFCKALYSHYLNTISYELTFDVFWDSFCV